MNDFLSRLGVCSWSLQPQSPSELAGKVRAVGLRRVQLHLDPLRECRWRVDETVGLLKDIRASVVSGMMTMKGEDYSTLESIKATGGVRPDETWEENLKAAEGNAVVAMRLGLPLVTFHAGFVPHDRGDKAFDTMCDRLVKMAEVFGARRVRLALETGQESASALAALLDTLNQRLPQFAQIGANFDPANMILYGMGDPVEAVGVLGRRIVQVHLKDARPSDSLGEWGSETPLGRGSVDWQGFFDALRKAEYRGNFIIEREAGDQRVEDVQEAFQVAARYLG
ncbi:MAG: sugar phosphate isomerase/epimerase [Phycisphaeraceae bacterium]|nr:sugar phosphate isomerase/epimerase [Phycisphaeraceae bacterium]